MSAFSSLEAKFRNAGGGYWRQSKGSAKSQDDQRAEGLEFCAELGIDLIKEATDGTSASHFQKKVRRQWPTVMEWITSRDIDVLILWEVSRADRKAADWLATLELCQKHNVKILVLKAERVLDPNDSGDWEYLAMEGIRAQTESKQMSKRIGRGVQRAAAAGKPHSRTPIGYVREYDPITRKYVRQIPDPATAATIIEIIERVAARQSLHSIAKDIAARPGIGKMRTWDPTYIRAIAMNPAYAGIREYTDRKGVRQRVAAQWDALVDEATHLGAVAYLAPRSQRCRPDDRKYMLSGLIRCTECGAGFEFHRKEKWCYYRCAGGHARIQQPNIDAYVMEHAAAAIAAAAIAPPVNDAEIRAAQAAAAAADTELAKLRAAAKARRLSVDMVLEMEPPLVAALAAANRRADELLRPSVSNTVLGDIDYRDADVVLARLRTLPPVAQHDIVLDLLSVTVRPLERGEGYGWRPARVTILAAQ